MTALMIHRPAGVGGVSLLWLLLTCLVCVSQVPGQEAARNAKPSASMAEEEQPPASRASDPPADGILDTAQILNDKRRERLAATIDRTLKTHRCRLYLATYESLNVRELPAERAQSLASAWLNNDELGAVLVFIAKEERFAIATTNKLKLIDREGLLGSLPKQFDRLADQRANMASAVREAAMDMDYRVRKLIDGGQERARKGILLTYAGAVALLVLLIGVCAFVIREVALHNFLGRKLLFPQTKKQVRLGGRNAGGHSIAIRYGQIETSGQLKSTAVAAVPAAGDREKAT